MRQVTRKGLVTVAAAGGVLALSGGAAFADAGAEGAAVGSPGVLSGNNVQVPVHVPVQVCGNTADIVGLLNPTFGNTCVSGASGHHRGHPDEQGKRDGGGSDASGVAKGSPGVASGNLIQLPVDVPVQACGNSVNVIGALNPAMGNDCVNEGKTPAPHEEPPRDTPEKPGGDPKEEPPTTSHEKPQDSTPEKTRGTPVNKPEEQPSSPEARTVAQSDKMSGELAATGGGTDLGLGLSLSAGLLLGGAVLYRRARAARR